MSSRVRATLKADPCIDEFLMLETGFGISARAQRQSGVIKRPSDTIVGIRQVFFDMQCEIGEWPIVDAMFATSTVAAETRFPAEQRRGTDISDIEGFIPIPITGESAVHLVVQQTNYLRKRPRVVTIGPEELFVQRDEVSMEGEKGTLCVVHGG